MAQGDLTQTIDADYKGAFNQFQCDANETVSKLWEVIGVVQGASSAVGVDEIVKGNMNLNQCTEKQAPYLEQTTSSMDELTSTVRQNADSASQANKLAAAGRPSWRTGPMICGGRK